MIRMLSHHCSGLIMSLRVAVLYLIAQHQRPRPVSRHTTLEQLHDVAELLDELEVTLVDEYGETEWSPDDVITLAHDTGGE